MGAARFTVIRGARPLFSYIRESIEAHLTIVFTALAIARYLQQVTGPSIREIVRTLQPLLHVTISVAGQQITAEPQVRQRRERAN